MARAISHAQRGAGAAGASGRRPPPTRHTGASRNPTADAARGARPSRLPPEDRRVHRADAGDYGGGREMTQIGVSQPQQNVFLVSGTIAADAGPTLRVGENP